MAINKQINLNINATESLKSLESLKLKSKELSDSLEGIDIKAPDFSKTKKELEQTNSLIKTFGSTSQEASDIATEAFVKTSQALVATTGTLISFAASSDQADKVTAKLAQTLALVESIEKIAQATKAVNIFLQEKANEAQLAGAVTTNIFATAQGFLSGAVASAGAALKALYVVVLANPFTAIAALLATVVVAMFAFSESAADAAAKQDKLNASLKVTNDLISSEEELLLKAVVAEIGRTDKQKAVQAEILGRDKIIANQKAKNLETQIKLQKDLAKLEAEAAKNGSINADEQELIDKKNIELRQNALEFIKLEVDNKDNFIKGENLRIQTQSDNLKKQFQNQKLALANDESIASKTKQIEFDLAIALEEINARELQGDKNTNQDKLAAQLTYKNALEQLLKSEETIRKERADKIKKAADAVVKNQRENTDKLKEAQDEADKNAQEEQDRQKEALAFENQILEAKQAAREVNSNAIKKELADDKTTFEQKIKLTNELFEIEKSRIEFDTQQKLKNIDLSLEEQELIKKTAAAQIEALTSVKDEANKANESFNFIGIKSEKDLKAFVKGMNEVIAAVGTFNDTLKLAGVESSNAIFAINNSVSILLKSFATIGEDGKFTLKEIAEELPGVIIGITDAINQAIQISIANQVEQLDDQLTTLQDRKSQLDADISTSISKQKDLEDQLKAARGADRIKVLKAIDAERTKEKQLAQDKIKFAKQEEELIAKKKELQKKAFIANKAASLISAGINTAVAITSALTVPPPAGPILAVLNGVLGAAQIAIIASQPVPEFKRGGFTSRTSNDSDAVGTVHANEYVVPARLVRSPRFRTNIQELESARLNGYASGGFVTPSSGEASNQLEKILQTSIALSKRPIVVSVIDINTGQERVAQVIDSTTL